MKKLGIGLLAFTLIGIIIGVIYSLSSVYGDGGIEDMMAFGTTGGIFGIILGLLIIGMIKFFGFLCGRSGGSSSSSSSSSSGSSYKQQADWVESRKNDPHTCSNCTKYLNSGVCRLDGSSKSATDSCSNWD